VAQYMDWVWSTYRNGVVAGSMRRSPAEFHYIVRGVTKKEERIIRERFADTLSLASAVALSTVLRTTSLSL
jgi:hypothetical protein